MRPKRILVLFPSSWDQRHFGHPRYRGRYDFIFYDQALWTFPAGLLRILRFDPVKYIDRVVRDCARLRIDGVVSTDEYVGSIIAAAVAKRLGLPGHDPATVIQSTHKYYARLAQQQIAPELVPAFQLMPVPPPRADEVVLPFPMFVKPVRGSFSIFAARCDSYSSLHRHLDLNAAWRLGLRSVLRPFNDLLRHFTGYRIDVNRFIGESYMPGHQVCIDGFVHEGELSMMGVVDAVFYPGTTAFKTFVYPSALSHDVQQRMHDICERLVRGLGITHGQFNVELIYDADLDAIRVLELHPRLSFQFADMYADVDGANTYDILLRLVTGERPEAPRGAGRYPQAASLIMRKFHGRRVRSVPDARAMAAFAAKHAHASVEIFAKPGSMNPEMRAMGNYRCAVVNFGADSQEHIDHIVQDAERMLPFHIA